MSSLTAKPWIRKIVNRISEIWFFVISSVLTFEAISLLITRGWNTSHFVFLLLVSLFMGLLIKQIYRKTGWISLLLGTLFAFASFWMIGALLSEYDEFPTGTEPNAIKMLIVGGALFGTSLILAIRMWMQGVHKMYTS